VIIDHAHRLHEGVADGRSNEIKPTLFQVFAHGVRGRSSRGNLLERPWRIHLRLAVHELPNVTIEGTKLFLYAEKCLGIRNRRSNFKAIPHNAGIAQQAVNLTAIVTGNALGIESVKRFSIILALVENRAPA
jgi:hypothetical protein